MKALHCLVALAGCVATCAQAQLLPDAAARQLVAGPAAPVALVDVLPRTTYSTPREPGHQTYPRVYGGNLAHNPNDRLFNGAYKTDPRLMMGIAITPTLAFEAGYLNLVDLGFHPINERDPEDTTGAIGQQGFNTHLAAKITRPLSERLSAYGKLGIAHSEQRIGNSKGVDVGLYTGVGAKYKVSERVTVDGAFENHGHAAERWHKQTNSSSSVKARMNMGF